MPYWSVSPVNEQPQITLSQWRVFEVDLLRTGASLTRHFVGRSLESGNGRVSSPIQKFDPLSGCGVTRSGRVYRLAGDAGYHADASYTWAQWKSLNGTTDEQDVTDQVIRSLLVSTEGRSIAVDMPAIPADFPRPPYLGAVAGAQPKLLVRRSGDKYVSGVTDAELQSRYEICLGLIRQYVAYGLALRAECLDYSAQNLIDEVAVKMHADITSLTHSEIRWVLERVILKLT